MRFANIPGHEDVKNRLRHMVETGHMPHALLLQGIPGIGKFALARAYAQYIHCQNKQDGDSCGKCPACIQHQNFNHIDTLFSFPVVKKGSSTAVSDMFIDEFKTLMTDDKFMNFESWRPLLGDENAQPMIYVDEVSELSRRLSFTSHASRYKIVLVWQVDRMNETAANKMLKLLEEPFEDTLFILTTDKPNNILPTIYSRTQRITVHRYTDAEIASLLCRDYALDMAAANQAASLSDGSYIKAVSMVSLARQSNAYLELFKRLMRLAYQRNVKELRAWGKEVAELGREPLIQFFDYCAHLIGQSFVSNLHDPVLTNFTADEAQFTKNFAPFINHINVQQLADVFTTARNDIATNTNPKMVTFDVAVRVILLIKAGTGK